MRRKLAAALLLAALAAPARADGDRVAATLLPACSDGEPFFVYIVDASADDDCDATGGGTTEAPCLCLDGSYVAMLASGGGGAPTNADYLVKTANGSLSAERVVTDTDTIAWNWSTGGQAKAEVARPRPASFENPPASPHAYDDEFNTTSLDAKWTITSSGTTNAATSGSVNPTSSLTTPIVDAATQPGWLLMQSDNSSVKMMGVYQTVSLDTNASILIKLQVANGPINGSDEGDLALLLWNSSDANETLTVGEIQQPSGSGYAHQITVQNNGSFGSVTGAAGAEKWSSGPVYVLVWKVSDVYHAMFARGAAGMFTYLGSVTKTGVTTFDRLSLVQYTANETPSLIGGFDFIRYYASNTYGLVNN